MEDTLIQVYFTYEGKKPLNAVFNCKKTATKDVVFKGCLKEATAQVRALPEFQISID